MSENQAKNEKNQNSMLSEERVKEIVIETLIELGLVVQPVRKKVIESV